MSQDLFTLTPHSMIVTAQEPAMQAELTGELINDLNHMETEHDALHPDTSALLEAEHAARHHAPTMSPPDARTTPARETSRAEPAHASPEELEEAPSEGLLDELLRKQDALIDRIERGEELLHITRVMLATAVIGTAAFGAAVGFYRGGVQILFAALKLPLVIVLTVALCAPVYTTMKAAMRQRADLLRDITLLSSALALASLVSASLIPILLLAIFQGTDYHKLTLLTVALGGLGGAAGFLLFTRGLARQVVRGKRLIYMSFFGILVLVSAQFSWVMRPYLVRPRTENIPFTRAAEGSFFDAVSQSWHSARTLRPSPTTYAPLDAPAPTPRHERVSPLFRSDYDETGGAP